MFKFLFYLGAFISIINSVVAIVAYSKYVEFCLKLIKNPNDYKVVIITNVFILVTRFAVFSESFSHGVMLIIVGYCCGAIQLTILKNRECAFSNSSRTMLSLSAIMMIGVLISTCVNIW